MNTQTHTPRFNFELYTFVFNLVLLFEKTIFILSEFKHKQTHDYGLRNAKYEKRIAHR